MTMGQLHTILDDRGARTHSNLVVPGRAPREIHHARAFLAPIGCAASRGAELANQSRGIPK